MKRSRPSIAQLECFVAVAELSSYRRAAERLRLSQPTLTSHVLGLESLLGVRLFERSRAGTLVTPIGRDLLPAARAVLEQTQGLLDFAASATRGPAGTYRLGVKPTLGPYFLPHVLPVLHRRYASLRLYVREAVPRDLEAGLENGDFDLILTALPVELPRATVVPLFREPLRLVLPADHPLARRERIEPADLIGESVLTIDAHHHFHRQIAEVCERLGARLRRDWEGTSLDTLRQMVVMGMGIAFLPALYIRSEIHRPSELRVADIEGETIERTHVLAWRTSSPSRALFREITDVLVECSMREFENQLRPASTLASPHEAESD
ncbi:MAG: hydrogen peroxide-inducible genes activator [Deltaproteobacteria bacterium]|nr:hydrogen peroxide-inducible genes activator [Deltaproteobacteria bacterium]